MFIIIIVFFFYCLPVTIRFKSHRTDLLPLSVQFCLLVGLFEATRFPALRHLDSILEGCPAETNVIRTPSRTTPSHYDLAFALTVIVDLIRLKEQSLSKSTYFGRASLLFM